MAPRKKTTVSPPAVVQDGLSNVVSALGTGKDPRTATQYTLTQQSPEQLLTAYRSNWLAGRIVDSFAEDATREWRSWQASEDQIEKLEEEEKRVGAKKKVQQALVRARLFGGAGIIMGIDGAGDVSEPLDLDQVGEGALKFLVVLSSFEMSRGQLIVDANSPWFGRPSYYRVNTGRAELGPAGDGQGPTSLSDIHPSRVIEFVGREIPSWDITNGTPMWGDSVLTQVDDVLKDYGTSLASIAALINDCKVDVFTIPGLTKQISNPNYEARITKRVSLSNQMKSAINAMLMDENEKWERVQTQFAGMPQIMSEMLKVVAGAAGIPLTRLVGHGSGSGKSTLGNGTSGGESDLRNYYDEVSSDQENDIGPRLAPLDEVLERSALGSYDPNVYYEWSPLYTPDPMEAAQIALSKAQAYNVDVAAGQINPDVLRRVRINQLIEDGFYPGLQDAIDELGDEPEEDPGVSPDDVAAHIQMLQRSSQQLQQIGAAAQPRALPKPGGKPQPAAERPTANDGGRSLRDLRMFR